MLDKNGRCAIITFHSLEDRITKQKFKESNNYYTKVMTKIFRRKVVKIIYCVAAVLINTLLTIWVVNTFMWA